MGSMDPLVWNSYKVKIYAHTPIAANECHSLSTSVPVIENWETLLQTQQLKLQSIIIHVAKILNN